MKAYPSLEEVVEQTSRLNPLPATTAQVLALSQDADISAKDFEAVVATDTALTARLLRMANSAYYGQQRQIASVHRAIVLIGLSQLRSVALSASLLSAYPTSNILDYDAFWRHSMTVAELADILARADAPNKATHDAFEAGILHNIGRLTLDQYYPDALTDVHTHAAISQIGIPAAQHALLGYTDAELGSELAVAWDLPVRVAAAIAGHQGALDDPASRTALATVLIKARLRAQELGASDGFEELQDASSSDWDAPQVSKQIAARRGWQGVVDKVGAVMEVLRP